MYFKKVTENRSTKENPTEFDNLEILRYIKEPISIKEIDIRKIY